MTPKEEAAFGARLRRWRLERGLSQRDLAEPVYTAAYISTVEAGKRRPSRPAIEHFAQRLGVGVDELLTGKPRDLEAQLDLLLNRAWVEASGGRSDEARKTLEQVRREARRYGLVRLEARALEGVARHLEREGELDAADEAYRSVLGMLKDEPVTARTVATTGIARLAQRAGSGHHAVHLLERFLVELVLSDLPDPQSMMSVHAALVLPYLDVGMRDRAIAHAEEALSLLSESHDPQTVATTHLQIARVLLEDDRVKDAEAALRRAEDIFKTLDLRTELATARLALGYALIRSGRPEDAKDSLKAAREVFAEVGRPVDRARAGTELARLYRLQGRPAEALPLVQDSIELLEGLESNDLARAYREMALCAGPEDAEQAERHLRRALELFELGEDKAEVAATYGLLGDLMNATGRTAEATASYRAGIAGFMDDGDGFGSAA